MMLAILTALSGCNRHLDIIPDAPNPEDIPPTDPYQMPLFYQISTDQAESLIKNNQEIYVLDFRSSEAFAAGHLPKAISLPWPDENFVEKLGAIDHAIPILGYADLTPELFNAILKVREIGFLNVHWLNLGFSGWVDDKKPVFDPEGNQLPQEKADELSAAEKAAVAPTAP